MMRPPNGDHMNDDTATFKAGMLTVGSDQITDV